MIAIDLVNHTLVDVRRIPDLLPRNSSGKKVALATIYRWIQRYNLPVIRVGARQYSSTEALQAWCQIRTQRDPASTPPAPGLRQKSAERAAAQARVILLGPQRDASPKGLRSTVTAKSREMTH